MTLPLSVMLYFFMKGEIGMQEMKDIKKIISSLVYNNKLLYSINQEQKRIIDELMYKNEQLESDIEYAKVNGGIKKKILRKYN